MSDGSDESIQAFAERSGMRDLSPIRSTGYQPMYAPGSTTRYNPAYSGVRPASDPPPRVSTRTVRRAPVRPADVDTEDAETILQPRAVVLEEQSMRARAIMALEAIPSEAEFAQRIAQFTAAVEATPAEYLDEIYKTQAWDMQDLPRFLFMWRDLSLREAQMQRAPREKQGLVAYDSRWHREQMEPSLATMRHIDDMFNLLHDWGVQTYRDGNWIKGSRMDRHTPDWRMQRVLIIRRLRDIVERSV